MPHTRQSRFKKLRHLGVRSILGSSCILLLLVSKGWCQAKSQVQKDDEPVVTVALPSVDQFYSDLKFLFDLVNDENGYNTLKETIDVFLVGVETDKPGGVRLYATPDGLRAVGTLPVKGEAQYQKYLQNLFDLDVKTAPPPKPTLAAKIPKDVNDKLKSLKLQPDERLVFGLFDGFVKFESGSIHIGNTLEDVRLAKGDVKVEQAKGEDVVILINSSKDSAEDRRKALEKLKERILTFVDEKIIQKKAEQKPGDESETLSRLRKAVRKINFEDIGGILSESAHTHMVWSTSHAKKQSVMHSMLEPAAGSSLAKRIEQIGQLSNSFAGISKEGCVATLDFNLPNDPERQDSVKAVSKQVRSAVQARTQDKTNKNRRLNSEQVDSIFDLVDEMAGMTQRNGFLRTWSNGHESLTTVGGFGVSDTARIVELLQKFKGREGVTVELKMAREGDVDLHKVAFGELHKDVPELFDNEGAIYVGTGEKTVWYGVGEKALEHLKQAIQEGKTEQSKSDLALEAHAQLLPMAEVWQKISARVKKSDVGTKARANIREKSKTGEKHAKAAAQAITTLSDLEIPKLAVEAFKNGKDTVSMTLTRKGKGLELIEQFDEGVLRFAGLVLSAFVKENLAD